MHVQYAIAFLEGMITFISPCLLPMLPIYISYFAGGQARGGKRTLCNAGGFVLGFTLVFMALGLLAGTVGGFLRSHQRAVDVVAGIVVILFGLNFLGVLRFQLFKGSKRSAPGGEMGFFSAALFGVIFSLGWTPCVGAFLGSALMLASQQGSAMVGMWMLLCYSLGLGVPFLLSAVLIDQLKSTLDWIKRNYQLITRLSGGFLILVGVLMATGLLSRVMGLFN